MDFIHFPIVYAFLLYAFFIVTVCLYISFHYNIILKFWPHYLFALTVISKHAKMQKKPHILVEVYNKILN